MTIEQMREKVTKMYDSWVWRDRVARMSDRQVVAIYFKTKERYPEKFSRKKNKREGEYHQMTIFEFI